MDVLCRIIEHYGVPFDKLIFTDLSDVHLNEKSEAEKSGNNVHLNLNPSVHLNDFSGISVAEVPVSRFQAPKAVTVNLHNEENVVMVPTKASAGYLLGFADPEFISQLPAYTLPGLRVGTYRLFEVSGTSMFPTLQDGDGIAGKWATTADFRDDRVYILVHKTEGILVKRCLFRDGKVIAKSDNNNRGEFPNQVLHLADILEVWYVVQRITRHLSQPGELYKRISDLEAKFTLLEHRLNST